MSNIIVIIIIIMVTDNITVIIITDHGRGLDGRTDRVLVHTGDLSHYSIIWIWHILMALPLTMTKRLADYGPPKRTSRHSESGVNGICRWETRMDFNSFVFHGFPTTPTHLEILIFHEANKGRAEFLGENFWPAL